MDHDQRETHIVLESSSQRWISTILTSVGGALAAGLLIWIASSQLTITTDQAVIKRDLSAQTKLIEQSILRIEGNQKQIWPRLRAHGENIEILARNLENVCKCKVQLKKPEDF